jgi:hypothetical protein
MNQLIATKYPEKISYKKKQPTRLYEQLQQVIIIAGLTISAPAAHARGTRPSPKRLHNQLRLLNTTIIHSLSSFDF